MRKLITTLSGLLFTIFAYGQLEIPADPITYDLNFSIQNPNGFGLKVARKDSTTTLPDGILSIQTRINDADLVLQAKVTAARNREIQKFKLVLKDKNGVEITPAISDYVNYNNESTNKKIASNTIIWKNLTEDDSFLANEYTLTYSVEKYIIIGVDCDHPPQFGAKQQLPYLGGALVGAGLMAYSRKTRNDAKTAFKRAENFALAYQTHWENGGALDTEGVQVEGESDKIASNNIKNKNGDFINEGERLNNKHKREFIGGAIVLGVDLLAYITHRIIYNRKKKLYEEYCTNKKPLQVKPVIKVGDASSYNHEIGLGLTYTF